MTRPAATIIHPDWCETMLRQVREDKSMSKQVTHGQALLAWGAAQELCHQTYMATIGTEGLPNREEHVAKARELVKRVEALLNEAEKAEAA